MQDLAYVEGVDPNAITSADQQQQQQSILFSLGIKVWMDQQHPSQHQRSRECLSMFRGMLGVKYGKWSTVIRNVDQLMSSDEWRVNPESIRKLESGGAMVSDGQDAMTYCRYGILLMLNGFMRRNRVVENRSTRNEDSSSSLVEKAELAAGNGDSGKSLKDTNKIRFMIQLIPILASVARASVIKNAGSRDIKPTRVTALAMDTVMLILNAAPLTKNVDELWSVRMKILDALSLQEELYSSKHGNCIVVRVYQDLIQFLAVLGSEDNSRARMELLKIVVGGVISSTTWMNEHRCRSEEHVVKALRSEMGTIDTGKKGNADANEILVHLRNCCFLLGNTDLVKDIDVSRIVDDVGPLNIVQMCMSVLRMKESSNIPNFMRESIDRLIPIILGYVLARNLEKDDSDDVVVGLLKFFDAVDDFSAAAVEMVVHIVVDAKDMPGNERSMQHASCLMRNILSVFEDKSSDDANRNRKANALLVVRRLLESFSVTGSTLAESIREDLTRLLLQQLETEQYLLLRKQSASLFSMVNPSSVIPTLCRLASSDNERVRSISGEALCACIASNNDIPKSVLLLLDHLQAAPKDQGSTNNDIILKLFPNWAKDVPSHAWRAITETLVTKIIDESNGSPDSIAMVRALVPYISDHALDVFLDRILDAMEEDRSIGNQTFLKRLTPFLLLCTLPPGCLTKLSGASQQYSERIRNLLLARLLAQNEAQEIKRLSASILANLIPDVGEYLVQYLNEFPESNPSVVRVRGVLYCVCQHLLVDNRFLRDKLGRDLLLSCFRIMELACRTQKIADLGENVESNESDEDLQKFLLASWDTMSLLLVNDLVHEASNQGMMKNGEVAIIASVLDRVTKSPTENHKEVDFQLGNLILVVLRSLGKRLTSTGSDPGTDQHSSLLDHALASSSALMESKLKNGFVWLVHRLCPKGPALLDAALKTNDASRYSMYAQILFTACFFVQKLFQTSADIPIVEQDLASLFSIAIESASSTAASAQIKYSALKLIGVLLAFPNDLLKPGDVGRALVSLEGMANMSESKEIQTLAQHILMQLQ